MKAEVNPNRRLLILGIVAILALLLFAALFVAPRVPAVKSWRADHIASRSLEAMDQRNWDEAQNLVASAFQLSPAGLKPLQAAARLNAAAYHPQTLAFFQSLVKHPDADEEDWLDYAESSLRFGSLSTFDEILPELQRRLPGDPRVRRLEGRRAILGGETQQGIELLRQVVDTSATPSARLEYAMAQLESRNIATRQEALRELQEVGANSPELAGDAYTAILSQAGISPEERLSAISSLESIEGGNFSRRVQLAGERITLDPPSTDQVLAGLQRDATTSDEKIELARLLVRLGREKQALDLVSLALARGSRAGFLVWLDATAGLGRWQEVLDVVESSPLPIEPILAKLYAGRALQELGKEAEAATAFRMAVTMPTEDYTLLFYLAGYLHQVGRLSDAELVLKRLERSPQAGRFAAEALVNIYRTNRDSERLLNQLSEISRRWPDDVAARNDTNYLNLLLDRNLATSIHAAKVLSEENPALFPLQISRALALAKNNQPDEALSVFERSQIQLDQLLPFQRAIFAGLLRRNGMSEAADGVIASIPSPENLLPEEQQFAGMLVEPAPEFER